MSSLPTHRAGFLLCLATAALGGCQSLQADRIFGVLTPYRVEVVQGNVITSEQSGENAAV